MSVACALLALPLACLIRRAAALPLTRCVGGVDLCLMLGALLGGLIRRRRAALLARAQLRWLVTAQPTALVALTTCSGHVCYASPSFKTTLGFDPSLIQGRRASQHAHPADSAEIMLHLARIRASGIDQARFRLRHADGGWRWIEAHGARWGDGRAALVVIGHDITEQVGQTAEPARLQSLQSISRVAGAVAHDVNNLLTGIAGIAALDMQALPSEHALYGDLASIGHAADQAATLVGHLRTFTRPPPFAPRPLDLNALIGQFARFIERILGPEITVCVALSPGLAPVWGDRAQLEQVVLNLAINARDAMPGGGQLRIATADAGQGAGQPDGYVRLTVSDTGAGMDAETQARMFEPYFTTKAPGRGSGLGLATCAEIVQRHGGRIQVESTPGCGTSVTIDLPCNPQRHVSMERLVDEQRSLIESQH